MISVLLAFLAGIGFTCLIAFLILMWLASNPPTFGK